MEAPLASVSIANPYLTDISSPPLKVSLRQVIQLKGQPRHLRGPGPFS